MSADGPAPIQPKSDLHPNDVVLVPLSAPFSPSHDVYSYLDSDDDVDFGRLRTPWPSKIISSAPTAPLKFSTMDIYVPALVMDYTTLLDPSEVDQAYQLIQSEPTLARFPLYLDRSPPVYGPKDYLYNSRLLLRIRLLSHPHLTISYPFDSLVPWSAARLGLCLPPLQTVTDELDMVTKEVRIRQGREEPSHLPPSDSTPAAESVAVEGTERENTTIYHAESDGAVAARYMHVKGWATALVSQPSAYGLALS